MAHLQSRGQWGARDFDKVMLGLPIPKFDDSIALHRELADAATGSERIAAGVAVGSAHFVKVRSLIREALAQAGIAEQIERLVEVLVTGRGAS